MKYLTSILLGLMLLPAPFVGIAYATPTLQPTNSYYNSCNYPNNPNTHYNTTCIAGEHPHQGVDPILHPTPPQHHTTCTTGQKGSDTFCCPTSISPNSPVAADIHSNTGDCNF